MKENKKQEKEFLVSKGYLKPRNGKYPGLAITCKQKKSKRKKYYVLDSLAEKLKKLMYVKE